MQFRSESRILPQIRWKDRLKNQLGESVSRGLAWAAESRQKHSWSTPVGCSGVYVNFKSNMSKQEESGTPCGLTSYS